MSINACEQMATGVSDITSIALVTLEVIHNALLINELRLRFACRELLGNLNFILIDLAENQSYCLYNDRGMK